MSGREALYDASYQEHPKLVKVLLRKGAICSEDNDDFSGFI